MIQTVVIAYALILVLALIFQRRLIYLPTRLSMDEAERLAAANRVLPWRGADGHLIGWHWPASAASSGAVLIAHGNAGHALHRGYLAEPIREALEADVYVLEYPGYGPRDGSPSQTTLEMAAEHAFDALGDRSPIYLVSESLGAGVATHLAKVRGGRVHGLLLFAPFNRMTDVAQRVMPFLPMRILLRDRFDPQASLAEYRGPLVSVLAEADEVIAPEFGRRLYDSYRGPKRLDVIAGAHHNDIAAQSADWWKTVLAFWNDRQR